MAEEQHQLRLDLEELKQLETVAKRPRVVSLLSSEIRSLDAKLSKINAAVSDDHSSVSASAPALNYVTLGSFSWDQDNDKIKIYVFLEGVNGEKVETNFQETSVDVKFHDVQGKNYRITIPKLNKEIVPEKSKVLVKATKIIITLIKASKGNWLDLHFKEDKILTKDHEFPVVHSEKEAYEVYCEYAHIVGFSVRKDHHSYWPNTKNIKSKYYTCSKAGFKRQNHAEGPTVKFRRMNNRTGCPRMMTFNVDLEGNWTVGKYIEEHNHELASIDNQHLLRSLRNICKENVTLLKSKATVEVSPTNAFTHLAEEVGVHNVDFSKRGDNFVIKESRVRIESDDSSCLSRNHEFPVMYSEREAYEMYCKYAYTNGFSVRKDHHSYWPNTKNIKSKLYMCSKAGFKRKNHANVKYRRMDKRTGCPAMMTFNVDHEGSWTVGKFIEEHNHELANIIDQPLLSSQKIISQEATALLKSMSAVRVGTMKTFSYHTDEVGVHSDDCLKQDAYNFVQKNRRTKIERSDSSCISKNHDFPVVHCEEEAYEIYCKYAHTIGFSVRKDHHSYWPNTKNIKSKLYSCSKAGFKRENQAKDHNVKFRRIDNRTGCPAMVSFSVDLEGNWAVTKFKDEHNHELANINDQHLLRSSRSISKENATLLKSMTESGIRTVDAFSYLANEVGGVMNLGFSKRDAYNFLQKQKRTRLACADPSSLFKNVIRPSL